MKIAYLILAHDNPAHLQRLIRALRADWNRIFVHIDRKAAMDSFDGLQDEPQTELISNRVSACWGGFSLVQATLNLLEAATSDMAEADWFVLLSGADYPIRTNQEIQHFFRSSKSEHIGLLEMPTPDQRKPLARLETLHFEKSRGRYMPQRVLLTQTNRFLARYYKREFRSVLGDLTPYAGSQWWALSREAVDYMLDFVPAHPRLVKFYKYSLIPDEMFFHTIIGNSRFKENIARNVTYADWTKGRSRNPAALTDAHIDRFSDPNFELDDIEGRGACLFARKFSASDGALLNRIDGWRKQ